MPKVVDGPASRGHNLTIRPDTYTTQIKQLYVTKTDNTTDGVTDRSTSVRVDVYVRRRAHCIIDLLLAYGLGATHARYTHATYLVLRQ